MSNCTIGNERNDVSDSSVCRLENEETWKNMQERNTSYMYKRILVWFRRDLRVHDNPALLAGSLVAEDVVPVYVYAPEEEGQFQPGRCSRWWLTKSLESLDEDLKSMYSSRLMCFRASDSGAMLETLVKEFDADGVFFNHLYDPISMVRDNEVKTMLCEKNIMCQSFNSDTLREPWNVVNEGGMPFTSFESFWRAHQSMAEQVAIPAPAPERLGRYVRKDNIHQIEDLGIMSAQEEASNAQLEVHWKPGRAGGVAQLERFIKDKLKDFSDDKAKTDRYSTSKLSPFLHFGEIGVREVQLAIIQATSSWQPEDRCDHLKSFYKQLGYREYSRYLSFHFPFTHERAMLEHLRAVPWRYDQTMFKAWRTGNTGYPIVDAAMREIWSTGWMHNRCRVICASFLVKYLLLPWQWGLKHFWDALLDADLECDTLGWQYCAGCLADGHDFSMVMDLEKEVEKYDPNGTYVRRWIPILARLPTQYIHCPWKAPRQVLEDAGVELGDDYPYPVIEFETAQNTLSKVADAVGTSSLGNQQDASSGPYRPATMPLPDATSIEEIVGSSRGKRASGHGTCASSIASLANNAKDPVDTSANCEDSTRKRKQDDIDT